MATNTNHSSFIKTVKTKTGSVTGNGGVPGLPADFVHPESGMWEIKLSRLVMLNGHTYSPRYRQVVDEATKTALGDAVIHAQQL